MSGHELARGSNLATRVKKLIMMDSEGVQIGATMFNIDIDYFAEKFGVNKTYLISNAEVKEVERKFSLKNQKKELILKKYTVINETNDNIDLEIQYNFAEYEDMQAKFRTKEEFDIYGTLVSVKDSQMVSSNTKVVRDITIKNKNQFLEICLWEDMAMNERSKLQQVVGQHPIIVITNVTAKSFFGGLQLQSTMKSILQISPKCQEIEQTLQTSCEIYDPLEIDESKMIQKMKSAKEVSLKDLKENQHILSTDCYYCFTGNIDAVEIISSMWYNSCKKCSTSCPESEEIIICKKCGDEVLQTVPRYRITLNITEGDCTARVTLFNEVAAVYVGCSVDEYISSIRQNGEESAYYRALNTQRSMGIRSMTTLKSAKIDGNGNLTLIANAIQRICHDTMNTEKNLPLEVIEEPSTKQLQGKKWSIRKAKPNEIEENKKSSRKAKQTGERKNKKLELQHDEVKGKRKRRPTLKKLEQYIEILSDSESEETLDKIFMELKKSKKKCSPPIKIKQEKID